MTTHRADARVRRLPTNTRFIALLYAQAAGAVSLRETVVGLQSHASRLYHLGARTVRRSTLADANAQRPSAVFTDLFADMVSRAHRGPRRGIGEATLPIDSTSLVLNARSATWARFSASARGAKLDAARCRIVTRVKRNTPLKVIETLALPPGSAILSDRIGFLPGRRMHSRGNPMAMTGSYWRPRTTKAARAA